jgi:hypothetical protein
LIDESNDQSSPHHAAERRERSDGKRNLVYQSREAASPSRARLGNSGGRTVGGGLKVMRRVIGKVPIELLGCAGEWGGNGVVFDSVLMPTIRTTPEENPCS